MSSSVQLPHSSPGKFNLERFLLAQDPVYADVVKELQRGKKHSHWMWFIFPQLRGLGTSHAANFYGLSGLAEATAYLEHPQLGVRLHECMNLMLLHEGRTAISVLGSPDHAKLRSCAALFRAAAPEISVFDQIIKVFYQAVPDQRTLELLQ